MNEQVKITMENLKRNNMQPMYFESSAEAVEYIKGVMPKGAVITVGGSITITETGLRTLINNGDYRLYDKGKTSLTDEQVEECNKMAIGCDFFFTSSNAVTEDGYLVNADGYGNRICPMTFGPKKVFVLVGVNKIVKDVDEGFLRIKKIAAPKNTVRLGYDTPCSRLGKCVALLKSECPKMTDGCDAEQKICRNYIVTGKQKYEDRMTVIIINENLGF